MKIVIMAGGRGTRIAEVNSQVPKPMIPLEGKPILEHQIETLGRQGYRDLVLVIGHLGHVIRNHFGDGSRWGASIRYVEEETPLGTAGALYYLKDEIREDFLLLNGDVIFDVDVARFAERHRRLKTMATILTHPNDHPYDSGIIVADETGRVTDWLHKEDERLWYRNRVNAGMHMLAPDIFRRFPDLRKRDLDRDVLKPLIPLGELGIYDSPEYVRDMGTPDRLDAVARDIREGRVEARNLSRKQRAVFLDRDGTLNKHVGFLTDIDDMELEEGAAEAVRKINAGGYLAIVVTNQPVVARGEVTEEGLRKIHDKLETLLGREGAYVDDILYCPHHPHKGYEGERPEYKIECDCRKPKPGLLLRAAEKYNIDLTRSWMIGDGRADVEAGRAAGCRTVLLDGRANLLRAVEGILAGEPTAHVESLVGRYPALEPSKEDIRRAYDILEECFRNGGKLLIAGNGGSAADAEHVVGELMKGFRLPRKTDRAFADKLMAIDQDLARELSEKLQGALPAMALTGHAALSTAYLNDVDGRYCFAQQVYGYGAEGDAFLGISTSGNSANVIAAAVVAKARGMKVVGLTGEGGGRLGELADVTVRVPERETHKVQEFHLPVYHCLCLMLEERFFG